MSQNIHLAERCFDYWFGSGNGHYGIYDKKKFTDMFLPFLDIDQIYKSCEHVTENSITVYDIQHEGDMDDRNINIMLCVENCKFWKHYKHMNKYGNYGNKKISIYIYNHIDRLIITNTYIVIPVIYLQIDYYMKYRNSIKPDVLTDFDKKKFCLIVSFSKPTGETASLDPLIQKIKKIGQCDNIKDIKELKNCSCYHSMEMLNVFNRYKFIICFENSVCDGYITEKIFNATFARTIPIYHGPSDVSKYFNQDRFVDMRQKGTDIINKIVSLSQSETLYSNYINNSLISRDFDDGNFIEKTNNYIRQLNIN